MRSSIVFIVICFLATSSTHLAYGQLDPDGLDPLVPIELNRISLASPWALANETVDAPTQVSDSVFAGAQAKAHDSGNGDQTSLAWSEVTGQAVNNLPTGDATTSSINAAANSIATLLAVNTNDPFSWTSFSPSYYAEINSEWAHPGPGGVAYAVVQLDVVPNTELGMATNAFVRINSSEITSQNGWVSGRYNTMRRIPGVDANNNPIFTDVWGEVVIEPAVYMPNFSAVIYEPVPPQFPFRIWSDVNGQWANNTDEISIVSAASNANVWVGTLNALPNPPPLGPNDPFVPNGNGGGNGGGGNDGGDDGDDGGDDGSGSGNGDDGSGYGDDGSGSYGGGYGDGDYGGSN